MRSVLMLLAAALIVPVAGCDSSDDESVPNSLSGTFADEAGKTGTLAIDISDTTSLAAASTFGVLGEEGDRDVVMVVHVAGGGNTALDGRFDSRTGVLRVNDEGYRFDGTLARHQLAGTCESPDGSDGVFVAIVTDHEEITLYCGHYTGDDEGIFSVAVGSSGLALLTATSESTGPLGFATSEVQGNDVTFHVDDLAVTGEIDGDTIQGTWDAGSDEGKWAGSTDDCD